MTVTAGFIQDGSADRPVWNRNDSYTGALNLDFSDA
jgi:hypothetical protein